MMMSIIRRATNCHDSTLAHANSHESTKKTGRISPLPSPSSSITSSEVQSQSQQKIGLKLTRVILSSCVSLALILLLLLFFTSSSESASLINTSTSSKSTSINNNKNNNENNRLPSIPSNSYTFRIPYPTPRPYQQNKSPTPRVIVRLSSESGILRPQSQVQQQPQQFLKQTFPRQEEDLEQDDKSEDKSEAQEQDDYPYQFYLDFDENVSQQQSNSDQKSELLPLPSETFKPQPQLQNTIWSDFLSHQTATTTTTAPIPNSIPSIFNEIHDFDNYTIPSLRDYKFPEFKTSTNKPKKQDYLNPYEFFSEEDLENVADLDGDHSKYFVKTKPRDVSSSVANIYNSFYYEPPSYSTKTQPLPVKAKFPLAQDVNKLDNIDSYLITKTAKDVNSFNDHQFITYPESTTPMSTTEIPPTLMPMTSSSTSSPITTTTTESQNIPVTKPEVPTEAESILSSRSVDHHQRAVSSPSTLSTPNLNLIPDIPASTNPLFTTTTDATSIPGMPGVDFPIFDEVPVTSFDCQKQRYKGFFADVDTKCQAWHYCDFTDGHSTFLCPNGTLFSQVLLTCDWWFNVDCKQAQQLYVLNERLYRYIKPPKPSFPEDYHGPQVDLWLIKQLELGLLPKIKKRGKLIDKPPK